MPRSVADVILPPSSVLVPPTPHSVFLEHLKAILNEAKEALLKSHYLIANRSTSPLSQEFEIGDKVLVLTDLFDDPLHKYRQKEKWRPTYCGPFPITRKVSPVLYEIRFPKGARIHPIVNTLFLRACHESPPELFPDRDTIPPPAELVDGEEEYVVHDVVDFKLKRNEPYFLTRWEGYPDSTMEWCHYSLFFSDDGTVNSAFLHFLQNHPSACTPALRALLPPDVTIPRVPDRPRSRPSRYNS